MNFIARLANRLHKRTTIKCRLAGHVIWFRKIHVNDLLFVNVHPVIFQQEKSENEDLANKLYNLVNEETDKEALALETRKLIYRCMVKVKGDIKYIPALLKQEKNLNDIYGQLLWFSLDKFQSDKLLKGKLIDIYYLYKGMNYTHEFFGKDYLNKLEEFCFNVEVQKEGIKHETRPKPKGIDPHG